MGCLLIFRNAKIYSARIVLGHRRVEIQFADRDLRAVSGKHDQRVAHDGVVRDLFASSIAEYQHGARCFLGFLMLCNALRSVRSILAFSRVRIVSAVTRITSVRAAPPMAGTRYPGRFSKIVGASCETLSESLRLVWKVPPPWISCCVESGSAW